MLRTDCLRVLVAVGVAGLLGAATWAGSLTPPAGPVSPTQKTLLEVEPRVAVNAVNTPGGPGAVFSISQPGSYYLMGNVAGVTGKSGIEISASNVTLDLRGFSLDGGNVGVSGVYVSVGVTNCAIRDGQMTGWSNWGIDAPSGRNCRISGVSVSYCWSGGILTGDNAVVRDCAVFDTNNGDGFWVGSGSIISGCVSTLNDESGMVLGNGCTVMDSTCWQNGEHGIRAGNVVLISRCNVCFTGEGGISANLNSQIVDSVVSANGGVGINIGGGIVRGCTASENGAFGISTYDATMLIDNVCTGNGYYPSVSWAGIWVQGSGCRIEGNTVRNNADAGIRVSASGNLLIRNVVGGSAPNYEIAAGNTVGPIVNSGNIATSSNPHANYEY